MKRKKEYKMVKRALALALAGVMVTSFAGCHSELPTDENESEKINLINEDGEVLSIIGFADSKYCDKEELYGYFMEDNTKFYDVLNQEEIKFTDYKDYDVYYLDFKKVLSNKDYKKIVDSGYVFEEQIQYYSDHVWFSNNPYDDYFLTNKIGWWYSYFNPFATGNPKFNKLKYHDNDRIYGNSYDDSKEMKMR